MDPRVKKLSVGAVRLAAMAQLGPLAGGLFFAGGAVAAKILAESEWVKSLLEDSEWAKTGAEMLMHLGSHGASELFRSAIEGFRSGHNGDIEKSMQQAALEAITHLKHKAPEGYVEWFTDWESYLQKRPATEVFAGARGLDPVMLQYDDHQFRDLWWSRMEPVLAGWLNVEKSGITQLHLGGSGGLPAPLSMFLRQHLPEAMQIAHEDVLRDEKFKRSWIAFQQHVYGETLNQLKAIREQLDRIEGKLDTVLDRQAHAPAKNVWNIPLPTQTFQDRPDLIVQIDRSLEKGVTALTALSGLGGIGKTQLARGYAQQRHDRYKLGVWIEAETEVSLMSSFSALGPLLGLLVEQDQKAMAARVLNELSAHEPWLVIFDNAEKADALRPYVERLSGNGRVLITSRNEQWDGLASTVSVTQWSVEESARFMLERTKQGDRAAAEGLARDLDGLVLALEHAAAYMLAGDGMTLAEYWRVWREKLKWGATGHSYPDSVAAALGLSIDAVSKMSEAAYELLCLFAWLAPDLIPRKELLEAGAEKLPEALRKAFADHDAWNEVIETLGSYSLLKREKPDGVVTGYSMHRVVQEVVRERMGSEEGARWLAAACDVVDAAFPRDSIEPKFWAASEVLLSHARSIREHVRLTAQPVSLGLLLNEAGTYLMARGLYNESRDFQELALESDLRQLGPDHPHVAIDRSNLANILGTLGEAGEARKQIELALESDLRQRGPDHPKVAIRRSNLANILSDLGEHADARKQIELALESDLRQLGPDHPKVAIDRSNLANILGDLGEHEEARTQIDLALGSALRQLGPDHPSVAIRRSTLAIILSSLGEHAEARKQIELALGSDMRQLGPEHPLVAVRRANLAVILYHLGEREAALREIDLALEIHRKKLPPGHPNILGAEGWRRIILGGGG